MVAEVRSEHPHETAALRHVSGFLGMNVETLRLWVRRAVNDQLWSAVDTRPPEGAPSASTGPTQVLIWWTRRTRCTVRHTSQTATGMANAWAKLSLIGSPRERRPSAPIPTNPTR